MLYFMVLRMILPGMTTFFDDTCNLNSCHPRRFTLVIPGRRGRESRIGSQEGMLLVVGSVDQDVRFNPGFRIIYDFSLQGYECAE